MIMLEPLIKLVTFEEGKQAIRSGECDLIRGPRGGLLTFDKVGNLQYAYQLYPELNPALYEQWIADGKPTEIRFAPEDYAGEWTMVKFVDF